MATVKRELSPKINGNGKSEIIIRLSVGRGLQPRLKTGLFIDPTRFNDGSKDPKKTGAIIFPRANQKEIAELRQLEISLTAAEQFLLTLCTSTSRTQLSKEYIAAAFDRHKYPENYADEQPDTRDFFDTFDLFLKSRNLSERRVINYRVLIRALKRFESYRNATEATPYALTLDGFTGADVNALESFLRHEASIADKHPEIYEATPADTRKNRKTRRPQPRGDNTIVSTFTRLRAFFNWCNTQEFTSNKPFAKYTGVTVEHYGTPYYITIEERDKIADFNLPDSLAVQRDIFIFHCLIGCRVSDLIRLTPSNIINGGIEYIADKTKELHPDVVRVPLHPRAAAIVEKYAGQPDGRLLPFISPQRYNDAIKAIFTRCGITRAVTILNPTTGKEEQRPINEIASSHIARRTFIGNLYKRVKDPNLVGKLSGHKEGSQAFARYRDIDEDMRRELINLI